MGLFGFDPVKEAGGWEAAMTEEEIAEMEKKGYDMSSVRGKQAEIAAQEEADEAAFAEQRQATAVPTDLNMLGAIFRWKWVCDPQGENTWGFRASVYRHFGEKGYRILQGLGGIVIILCSVVLWVLM